MTDIAEVEREGNAPPAPPTRAHTPPASAPPTRAHTPPASAPPTRAHTPPTRQAPAVLPTDPDTGASAPTREHIPAPAAATPAPPAAPGGEVEQVATALAPSGGQYFSRTLPPELAERFTQVEELRGGGQAAIFLCARQDHTREVVAVKIYHHPTSLTAADPRPQLSRVPSELAVSYVEPYFGVGPDGRWWEVMEYLPLGNVAGIAEQQGGTLNATQLLNLVRNATDALEHLHTRSPYIIHRDIKPANLLVRSAEPFHAVLADFGLAVVTENVRTKRSFSGTDYYISPEAAKGDTRPARDWWALGMCVAELSSGRHPFQYDDGTWSTTITPWLEHNSVPLDRISDPRLLALVQGLVTRDPELRWSAVQVRQWLEGDTPPLADEWSLPASGPESPREDALPEGFTFIGHEFTDLTSVARAMKHDWQRTGAALAGRDLERLVDWVDAMDRKASIRDDVTMYLAARKGGKSSVFGNLNRLIAKIVTRLDPLGEPMFMHETVGFRSLGGWARRFQDGHDPGLARVVDELLATGALAEYAKMPGLQELATVQDHWEELVGQSKRYFRRVPDAGEMNSTVRALCLRLAVERVADEMRRREGAAI